jgi:hypothetical protein
MMRFLHASLLSAVVGTGVCLAAENSTSSAPRTTELVARFRDGTTLRRITLQEGLEIQTKYGKLMVPISAIRRVEFGRHTSAETLRRIAEAVRHLGSADFQQREAASKALIELGASAHPALVEAAKSSDQEVVRRAQAALLIIRERIPEGDLRIAEADVIQTGDCVLSGRILAPVLKAKTANFGELPMKLADLRSLHALSEARLTVDAGKHSAFGYWLDTGIAVDGDLGLVIVGSGQVDLVPQQAGQHVSNPNGYTAVGVAHAALGGQAFLAGSLVGRIGETGEPFLVGQRFSGKRAAVGKLYLAIVPLPGAASATGSYTVKVATDPTVTGHPKETSRPAVSSYGSPVSTPAPAPGLPAAAPPQAPVPVPVAPPGR